MRVAMQASHSLMTAELGRVSPHFLVPPQERNSDPHMLLDQGAKIIGRARDNILSVVGF